jgi:hypothetical protein
LKSLTCGKDFEGASIHVCKVTVTAGNSPSSTGPHISSGAAAAAEDAYVRWSSKCTHTFSTLTAGKSSSRTLSFPTVFYNQPQLPFAFSTATESYTYTPLWEPNVQNNMGLWTSEYHQIH